MTSEILTVVIDERKKLASIDNTMLLAANHEFTSGQAAHRRVFKDYILSSEVFYVDSTLD